MSFSVISEKFLLFWLGVQNFPFLTTWPKKRAHKKHYKNSGFRASFLKSSCASRNGHFWTKKAKFINSSYHFFCLFSSLSTTQNTNNCWNPYFYSVLANLKKENFQNLNLKHWKLKNPIFAPFFWKRLFLENCQKIGDKKKKHKMITECAKQISWNHYFYRLKTQTWTRE